MERQIKEMQFVMKSAEKIYDLTKTVNDYIEQGWQPYGELKIISNSNGSFLFSSDEPLLVQAMVKYSDSQQNEK